MSHYFSPLVHSVYVPCITISLSHVSQCLSPLYYIVSVPYIMVSISHVSPSLCPIYNNSSVPCIIVALSPVSRCPCLLYPSGLSLVSQCLCPLVLLSPVCLCDEHYISCLMIGASLACSYNKPEYTVHNNILALLSNSSGLYWYKICYILLIGENKNKLRWGQNPLICLLLLLCHSCPRFLRKNFFGLIIKGCRNLKR